MISQSDQAASKNLSQLQGSRSPLSKITNGQLASPTRFTHNQNTNMSPTRYVPKSLITSPSAPRVSMDGLPLLSQMNPSWEILICLIIYLLI